MIYLFKNKLAIVLRNVTLKWLELWPLTENILMVAFTCYICYFYCRNIKNSQANFLSGLWVTKARINGLHSAVLISMGKWTGNFNMKASLFTKTNYFCFWQVKIKKSILVELEAPDQRMLRYGSHINKSKHFWKWHILCNTCQRSMK